MNKIYCDRCGKEIVYPITALMRMYRRKYRITEVDKRIDLCQSCINSLYKWFKCKENTDES